MTASQRDKVTGVTTGGETTNTVIHNGVKKNIIMFKKLPQNLQQKYNETFRPKELQEMIDGLRQKF